METWELIKVVGSPEVCGDCGAKVKEGKEIFRDSEIIDSFLCGLCLPPKQSHTPTPWKFIDGIGIIQDEGEKLDMHLMNPKHKANAAFIVKAVNMHEDSIKAMRIAYDELAKWLGNEYADADTKKACDALAKAISKAEGK